MRRNQFSIMQKYPFPFRKAYFARFFNYNYSELVMVKAALGLYRYSSYVIFSAYRTCGLMLVLVQSPGL